METIANEIGSQSGAIWVTFGALITFGYLYNEAINYAHRQGFNDGYTWLEVVVGVAVTITAAGFTVGWHNVILMLLYFIASGLFMSGGDIWRHVRARRAEARSFMDDES